MIDAAWSPFVAIVTKKKSGLLPRNLEGAAAVLAVGAIVAVPLLVLLFPRWARRTMMPLLAITSMGVWATVPDVEHVTIAMEVVVVAALVCVATRLAPSPILGVAVAFFVVGEAIIDSAGRGAAIARTIGCFAVFIAAPVAGGLNRMRGGARRPSIIVLVLVHGVTAVFSSRGLIRQESVGVVVAAVGVALLAAIAVLLAASRPVPTPR